MSLFSDDKEKYCVFIAYYGNETNGSEMRARKLYKRINNTLIVGNKRVNAYFHPITNPYGRFEETPSIVQRTPLFLLVVDKNIPRSEEGQLAKHRDDGTLRNLYEEVSAFHDSMMYKSIGGEAAAKLFIADDLDFKSAEMLHPMFSGKIALNNEDQVIEWIRHFYTNDYINRMYTRYKYLANKTLDVFLQGAWVKEAECMWQCTKSEAIGRALLLYFYSIAENGSEWAVSRMRSICDEFSKLASRENSSEIILYNVKTKFNIK